MALAGNRVNTGVMNRGGNKIKDRKGINPLPYGGGESEI
jgi:hypothetical protein